MIDKLIQIFFLIGFMGAVTAVCGKLDTLHKDFAVLTEVVVHAGASK